MRPRSAAAIGSASVAACLIRDQRTTRCHSATATLHRPARRLHEAEDARPPPPGGSTHNRRRRAEARTIVAAGRKHAQPLPAAEARTTAPRRGSTHNRSPPRKHAQRLPGSKTHSGRARLTTGTGAAERHSSAAPRETTPLGKRDWRRGLLQRLVRRRRSRDCGSAPAHTRDPHPPATAGAAHETSAGRGAGGGPGSGLPGPTARGAGHPGRGAAPRAERHSSAARPASVTYEVPKPKWRAGSAAAPGSASGAIPASDNPLSLLPARLTTPGIAGAASMRCSPVEATAAPASSLRERPRSRRFAETAARSSAGRWAACQAEPRSSAARPRNPSLRVCDGPAARLQRRVRAPRAAVPSLEPLSAVVRPPQAETPGFGRPDRDRTPYRSLGPAERMPGTFSRMQGVPPSDCHRPRLQGGGRTTKLSSRGGVWELWVSVNDRCPRGLLQRLVRRGPCHDPRRTRRSADHARRSCNHTHHLRRSRNHAGPRPHAQHVGRAEPPNDQAQQPRGRM